MSILATSWLEGLARYSYPNRW